MARGMENLDDVLILCCATDVAPSTVEAEAQDGGLAMDESLVVLVAAAIAIAMADFLGCGCAGCADVGVGVAGTDSSSGGSISDESPKGLLWVGRGPSDEDLLFIEVRSEDERVEAAGDSCPPPSGSRENSSPKMLADRRKLFADPIQMVLLRMLLSRRVLVSPSSTSTAGDRVRVGCCESELERS
jgi:hypothetical protein